MSHSTSPNRSAVLLARAVGVAVLSAALAACSATPAPGAERAPAPDAATSLVTVSVTAGTTEQALRAAFPGAEVLAVYPDSGRALLALPAGRAATGTLGAQAAAGVRVVAVEGNPRVNAHTTADSMGALTWAGGLTTWAGGLTTWAGGLPFMTAQTQADLNAFWARVNVAGGHALAPEQGAGVKVAVLDTGVDLTHPLLAAQLSVPAYSDYVDGDSAPGEERPVSGVSYYGHGTGVAGLVLQVAPKATILPYRVLNGNGEGSVSKVVQAMSRAVKEGATVINLSLGSTTDSTALNNAIADAVAQGVVVVNSAGNTGREGMLYPARNLGTKTFSATAGLIGVGSVTMNLTRANFTAYASNMTLTTPGEGVITAYPNGGLMRATGTSFSAPVVSGAVALAQSTGARTAATLASGLRAATTPNLDAAYNAKLGTGTVNVGAFIDTYR